MKVKMLVNQVFMRKLREGDVQKRLELANPERYLCFRDIFGKQDFGFILAGDFLQESRGEGKVTVYGLNDDMSPYELSSGIDSSLFLLSSFSVDENGFSSRSEMEDMLGYLERASERGRVGSVVNSSKSVLFEDKISALKLQASGFEVPQTYHFNSFEDFNDFVRGGGEYVIKHRFGQEGIGVLRVNGDNVMDFKNHNMDDYIVQERLATTSEKRIIIYDGDFLVARIIMDRMSPWEKISHNCVTGETRIYEPTEKEIRDSVNIMKSLDTLVGCVDWVGTRDGKQYCMELNGFGTGYGRGEHPYNVNREVALRLKRDFLQ